MFKLLENLDKITDPESFRTVTLFLMTLIILMSIYGFTVLDSKIENVTLNQKETRVEIQQEINTIREGYIPRSEWDQIDRRLSVYFDQLDRRLERIEARLDRN